jgi:hypothetical protein
MKELEILFRLNQLDKNLSLALALEVMGRVISTEEVLEEEGSEYDEDVLIEDTLEYALNEL